MTHIPSTNMTIGELLIIARNIRTIHSLDACGILFDYPSNIVWC